MILALALIWVVSYLIERVSGLVKRTIERTKVTEINSKCDTTVYLGVKIICVLYLHDNAAFTF